MTAPLLMIDRFRSVYCVPAHHPQPEEVRGRLDRVLDLDVSTSLQTAISEALPPSSGHSAAVWLIRWLDVEVVIDVGALDDFQIGKGWGAALARAIAYAIANGADGDNILYFPNQAAYVAQFLIDLGDGRAWNQWYFDTFDGLRALPISAAAREALTRDASIIPASLRLLAARDRLDRFLALLTDPDAARIATAWGAIDSLPPNRAAVEAVSALLRDSALSLSPEYTVRPANTLSLLAHLPDHLTGAPASVDAVFGLWEALRRASSPVALIDALAAGDLSQASLIMPAKAAFVLPVWISLVNSDRDWVHRIAAIVLSGGDHLLLSEAEPQFTVTPYGAAFVFAAALIWDRLDQVIASVCGETRADEDVSISASARCAVFAACQADANAAHDPMVRFVCGLNALPADSNWDDLNHISLAAFRERLASALYSSGRAKGRFLAVERVTCRDKAMILLRDITHDAWLLLTPSDRFIEGFEVIQRALPVPIEAVVAPGDLHPTLQALHLPIFFPDVKPLSQDAAESLARFQRRSKPAQGEIAHYERGIAAFPPSVGAEHAAALITLAHAVIRAFAHRLNGFEWSTVAYLNERFLDGISKVVNSGTWIEVTLPHSPLEIVLRMAGLDHHTFAPDWLEATTIQLRLP